VDPNRGGGIRTEKACALLLRTARYCVDLGRVIRAARRRSKVGKIATVATSGAKPARINLVIIAGRRLAGLRGAVPTPAQEQTMNSLMNALIKLLTRSGLLKEDLDYHLMRASMVIIFLFFGYQKWFAYEAQVLIPYISNGPLIFWMYPVFGVQGASWFLGVSEWTICALLFLGFWNKKLGILGALGSTVTFITTVTIIPFMPDGWAASAGGFPAMAGNVPFLVKDVVLLAASVYLLKQDVARVSLASSREDVAMDLRREWAGQ
jgi:uncharacterized membrane protein YkgB